MKEHAVKTACFLQLDKNLQQMRTNGSPFTRLVVGFSGGLDSAALLFLLSKYCEQHPGFSLEAIHVNHQLSPNAGSWQAHCESVCEQYAIPITVKQVSITAKGQGIEAAAREARYQVFQDACGRDGVLLLAHHLDDQVETLFIRLMRGSGPLGLSAMKAVSSHGASFETSFDAMSILRPLLKVPREALENFVDEVNVSFVIDESNVDIEYDRNYLRHEILPLLTQRWPAMKPSVSRSARLCDEAVTLMDEIAQQDALSVLADDGGLNVEGIEGLSGIRGRNLLRYCLRSAKIPLPSEVVLQRILDEVIPARQDAKPLVQWKGGQVCRCDGKLYLLLPFPSAVDDQDEVEVSVDQALSDLVSALTKESVTAYSLPWGGQMFACKSQEALLSLRSREGLSLQRLLPLKLQGQKWSELAVGRGNPKTKATPPRRPSKTLKKWWQEYRVPLWYRQCQPLLYCQGELVMVPGLLACEHDQIGTETEAEKHWIGWWPYGFESVVRTD